MQFFRMVKAIWAGLFVMAAWVVAPVSGQITLPPGGTVTPPNASPSSLFLSSQIVPFSIMSGTTLLYSGEINNRVLRENSTWRLVFSTQLRNPQPGLNGIVARVVTSSFGGFDTAVSWRSGSGSIVPSLASRSVGLGHDVTWTFSPGVFSNQDTVPCEVFSTAPAFANTGRTTIILTTGQSVTVTTYEPVIGSPVAQITSPAAFSCVCNPATITGTASDGGSLQTWSLEYAANPAGPYTVINSSTSPVTDGVLGVWNTTPVSQGYYFLRLTVVATGGRSAVAFTTVFVDKVFDALVLRSPLSNGVFGGAVCFDGTASDQCFRSYTLSYRPSGTLFFNTILTSTSGVINDPLGTWNAGGLPDGNYQVRFSGEDQCGNTATLTRNIVIDNTPPSVNITSPTPCESIRGRVRITGNVVDTNITLWVLEYTGGSSSGWTTIASGSGNVINGVLGTWETRLLEPCCYTLRLRAYDSAVVNCSGGHYSEYLVSIDVGDAFCGADFNQDGGIDGSDVQAFFEVWENGGCLP